MSLLRFNSPLSTIDPFMDQFGLMRDLGRVNSDQVFSSSQAFPVNLAETQDAYKLSVEVPGFKKNEISVDIMGVTVILKGNHEEKTSINENNLFTERRRSQSFERSIRLPSDVDPKNVEAKLNDGILDVSIGKVDKIPYKMTFFAAQAETLFRFSSDLIKSFAEQYELEQLKIMECRNSPDHTEFPAKPVQQQTSTPLQVNSACSDNRELRSCNEELKFEDHLLSDSELSGISCIKRRDSNSSFSDIEQANQLDCIKIAGDKELPVKTKPAEMNITNRIEITDNLPRIEKANSGISFKQKLENLKSNALKRKMESSRAQSSSNAIPIGAPENAELAKTFTNHVQSSNLNTVSEDREPSSTSTSTSNSVSILPSNPNVVSSLEFIRKNLAAKSKASPITKNHVITSIPPSNTLWPVESRPCSVAVEPILSAAPIISNSGKEFQPCITPSVMFSSTEEPKKAFSDVKGGERLDDIRINDFLTEINSTCIENSDMEIDPEVAIEEAVIVGDVRDKSNNASVCNIEIQNPLLTCDESAIIPVITAKNLNSNEIHPSNQNHTLFAIENIAPVQQKLPEIQHHTYINKDQGLVGKQPIKSLQMAEKMKQKEAAEKEKRRIAREAFEEKRKEDELKRKNNLMTHQIKGIGFKNEIKAAKNSNVTTKNATTSSVVNNFVSDKNAFSNPVGSLQHYANVTEQQSLSAIPKPMKKTIPLVNEILKRQMQMKGSSVVPSGNKTVANTAVEKVNIPSRPLAGIKEISEPSGSIGCSPILKKHDNQPNPASIFDSSGNIPDIDTSDVESESDRETPKRPPPRARWVETPILMSALQRQQGMDPDKIFGRIESVKMHKILGKSVKDDRSRKTMWGNQDCLTAEEERAYKKLIYKDK